MDFPFCPATLPASTVSLLWNGPLWACRHSTFGVLMTLSEPSLGGLCRPLAGPSGGCPSLQLVGCSGPSLGWSAGYRAGTSPASPRFLQSWNLLGKSCLSWFCTCPIPHGASPRCTPDFPHLSSTLRKEGTHPEERNFLETPAGIITDLKNSTYSVFLVQMTC